MKIGVRNLINLNRCETSHLSTERRASRRCKASIIPRGITIIDDIYAHLGHPIMDAMEMPDAYSPRAEATSRYTSLLYDFIASQLGDDLSTKYPPRVRADHAAKHVRWIIFSSP